MSDDLKNIKQQIYQEISDEIYRIMIASGMSTTQASTMATRFRQRMRTKGINDGQYYHEPFEVIRDPIGIGVQPQASPLVMDYRTPGKDLYPSKNQYSDSETFEQVTCPYCARATLTDVTSADDIGREDAYRCINCGVYVSKQELVDAQALANMSEYMTQNPDMSNVSSIPRWTPKSINLNKDLDLTTKDYTSLDYNKFAGDYESFADSQEYKRMLNLYLNDLTETQRAQIIAILKVGIKNNDTIGKIKREIAKVIGDMQRAETIARTEVMRLTNEGNRQRMKDRGVKKVEWVAGPYDGRTCEICHMNDRKIFSLQAIKNKIPAHPRCRCSFTEVYE